MFPTFVLTFLSLLGELFIFIGVAVFISVRKLGHGDVINVLSLYELFYAGCKMPRFCIKTLQYHHCLVSSWRFVCERIQEFGLIQLLVVVKNEWHLCHPYIKIANQSHILSCSDLASFYHFVIDVALLLGETLFWSKIGYNMVHYYN